LLTVNDAKSEKPTTTSFSVEPALLERVRELAKRRGLSVSALIVGALKAELLADEVAGASSNGRPQIGSGWSRTIVEPPVHYFGHPLPMAERATRINVTRRHLGMHTTIVGMYSLGGVPVECVDRAQKAFDAELARALAERSARIAALAAAEQEEEGNAETPQG
jgi:hypothetical protein